MNVKTIYSAIIFLLGIQYSFGQVFTLTKKEKVQKSKLFNMCRYVKKTDYDELDHKKLFKKYVDYYTFPEDTTSSIHPQRKEMFNRLLKGLDTTLDTINIKKFDAVPWNKYAYSQHLPRMLWQAEPVTHLFGKPLPRKDRTEIIAEGKKDLENTWVIFKKDKPEVPRYYILFDEKNRIISWFLLNQGGLHYFLPF